jgi:hypothetical protein
MAQPIGELQQIVWPRMSVERTFFNSFGGLRPLMQQIPDAPRQPISVFPFSQGRKRKMNTVE